MHTFALHDPAFPDDDFVVICASVGGLCIFGGDTFLPTRNAHAIYTHLAGFNPDTDETKGFNDVALDPGDVDTLGGTFYMKRTAATGEVGAQAGWPACGMPIPVRFTFDMSGGGQQYAEIPGGQWLSNVITVPTGDLAVMSRVQLPWIT